LDILQKFHVLWRRLLDMAETLAVIGLVSTIAQFVDFGFKVVDRLDEFKSELNEVPKTFGEIKIQLPLIIDTLDRTQNQANAGRVSEATARALKPLVNSCLEQVKLLSEILDQTVPAKNASSWQRRFQALKSLAHDKDVQRIASVLGSHVQLLTFHQATSNSDLSSGVLFPPSSQSRKPVFMVPFDRDDDFVGRLEILYKIKQQLNTGLRRAVLAGIGGVGYT
jgi:hypothetical protein